jgi:hypothetical protein
MNVYSLVKKDDELINKYKLFEIETNKILLIDWWYMSLTLLLLMMMMMMMISYIITIFFL